MNKKERRLALSTALQSAAGDIVVVDSITEAAGGCSAWYQHQSSLWASVGWGGVSGSVRLLSATMFTAVGHSAVVNEQHKKRLMRAEGVGSNLVSSQQQSYVPVVAPAQPTVVDIWQHRYCQQSQASHITLSYSKAECR